MEYTKFSFSNYPEKKKKHSSQSLHSMTPTISPALLDLSPLNTTQEKEIKILSLKQMLQRLPILLAQVKTGNTSDSILNEIRQTF